MATITIERDGYGVVEPNHLSAPRSGHVYGQLPANEEIEILENGMFVKYDYAAGEVNFDGDGPWFLVFNEEKLYDERKQMHKDYAMKVEDFYDGIMTPRVFAIELGDIYTTNCFAEGTEVDEDCAATPQYFAPNADGLLELTDDGFLKAVKVYTMPDGQPGVKLQCIKNQPAIQ